MMIETAMVMDLLSPFERAIQPALWLILPNAMLNVMTAFWLAGDARNRRRMGERTAPVRWVVFSLLIGLVGPAVTGPMTYHVWRDARRRRYAARFWLVLTAVFSVAGFIGYRVFDDARSRRMRAGLWSTLAVFWYGALLVGVPLMGLLSPSWRASWTSPEWLPWSLGGGIAWVSGFPIIYLALRRRIRFADVRDRLRALGLLDEAGDARVRVECLKTWFPVRAGVLASVKGYIKAVDGVSFDLKHGEVLGLVGESGCGKTTVGRAVLGLTPATSGRIVIDGVDLSLLNAAEMRAMRARMQMIFQDPIGSLNPRMTVGSIVGEGLAIHRIGARRERQKRVAELVERVGLSPAAVNLYPHEFSGGQRQRIGIARALALGADVLICDEPVSALDVSIQAQIINLMRDLQRDFRMSYLFIAHDLALVEHISDRIAVMYLGRIVEVASRDALYSQPLHPYTHALLASIPRPDPSSARQSPPLKGELPHPGNPPSGCRFRTRCPRAIAACAERDPPLVEYRPGHVAACIRIAESPTDRIARDSSSDDQSRA